MLIERMGIDVAREYIIKREADKLAADQDILRAKAHLRKEIIRTKAALFKYSNFRMLSSNKLDVNNFVVRYTSAGKTQNKVAQYWGCWEQFTDEGEFVRRWYGPCVKRFQSFPEFIKPRFIMYQFHKWHEEEFSQVPGWFRPLRPIKYTLLDIDTYSES